MYYCEKRHRYRTIFPKIYPHFKRGYLMPHAPALAIWRFFLIALVFLTYTPFYWLLLKLHKPTGLRFGRFYLSSWRKCIGYHLIIKGELSRTVPTLFVSNHSSYVDILVLGTFVPA